MEAVPTLDIQRVLELLPHRYPFLLIDRVTAFEADRHLEALKNVTVNEPFFSGHFPGRPIMPGVLILEAMAQATGLLAFQSRGRPEELGTTFYLVGADKVRFKRPVVPGDQLVIRVTWQRELRGMFFFAAEAQVDGRVVSSAELLTTMMAPAP